MVSASEILNARILVVDDQAANVSMLEQLLRGAGDALLTMVAGRLAATVREEDTVARLGEDADTLMKSADLALYEAKRAGKNVCRIAAHDQRL